MVATALPSVARAPDEPGPAEEAPVAPPPPPVGAATAASAAPVMLPPPPPRPPGVAPVSEGRAEPEPELVPKPGPPPRPPPGRPRVDWSTPLDAPNPGSSEPMPEADVRPIDARPRSRWYGAQTLFLDGIALGAVVAGAGGESVELAALGVGTYLLGPPIVHAVHGSGGRAWGSFGLRLGMPVGGALLASDDPDAVLTGLILGYVGAVVIDSAALAWERPTEPAGVASGTRIAPQLQVTQRGVSAGLSGVF